MFESRIGAKGLGRKSRGTERAQAQGIMTFGKASTGAVGEQWTMIKRGSFQSQRPIEQELAGGGLEQVFASHDLRDLHRGVVHNNRKLIRGKLIMAPHHKVSEI